MDVTSVQTNDFELQDFVDEANIDQFIDSIRGENEDDDVPQFNAFDCELINGFLVDNQFGPTRDGFDDFNGTTYTTNSTVPDQKTYVVPVAFPSFDGDVRGGEDDNIDGEDSSGTTMTTTTERRKKPDRSRTLISERRRRGRMKEKLYALRSLVPNITKMDKASIIGDAALYVQDLQMQAKKLKSEIAGLERSIVGSERFQGQNNSPKKKNNPSSNNPISKRILQVDVFQVEERGFYARIVCIRGQGVAVSLYRALESLTGFNVQTSNLATFSDKITLTFTLKVKESELDMNLPNLKLWMTGALLNQGFEI